MDDTFINLFTCIQGKPSTHANVSNLSYDNIMRIKIKDNPKLLGRENDGIIVRQMSNYIVPVGASLLPHVGGFLGGYITKNNIKTWYEHLEKPSWRPPNWMFAPVWTTLYTGMGYASYLVWRDGGGFNGDTALPLALYGTQLALNWAWTPLFFGAHKLGASLIEMGFLWVAAGATGLAFWRVNNTAGYLFMPYMAWLTLATALTYKIWKDNKDKID